MRVVVEKASGQPPATLCRVAKFLLSVGGCLWAVGKNLTPTFLLEGIVGRTLHQPLLQSRCLKRKLRSGFSVSGNDGVFGRRAFLGGVAFGALDWWQTMLVVVRLSWVWPEMTASSCAGLPMHELYLSG